MLHLLSRYSHDHDLVVEPGFRPKEVRWAIAFSADGRFLEVIELGDTSQKRNRGRTFLMCPDLSQPEIKRGGKGCRHFLVDSADVVALYGENDQEEKLVVKHEYFVNLLAGAASIHDDFGLIASALNDNSILVQIQDRLGTLKAKPSDKVTFEVSGRFLVDSESWHSWWRAFRKSLAAEHSLGEAQIAPPSFMRSLSSGELVEPAAVHPKITGLADVGGLAMGDAFASFKQDSFRSYGLEQSANAAVSEEEASAYRAALNTLLKDHAQKLAGAKVVHWFSNKEDVPQEEDPFHMLETGLEFLDELEDDRQQELHAQSRAQQLLAAIHTGIRPDLHDNRYYALSMSGSAGRVMVRDWMEGQFEDLLENINAWFEDLSIVHREGRSVARPPKFMAVLGALVRELNEIPAPTVAKLWRVAVRREQIPQQVLAQAFFRSRVDILQDQPANHARMGLIKAFHIRKGDSHMKQHLNEEHPSPAYHCGRLMAMLANLQYAALGDVGAGVIQRYFAAASTTPALVLGRLTRTSQFHLNKLDPGLAYWYENKIAGIWASMKDELPRTLTLEQQSLFSLGYYQQIAANRIPKNVHNKSDKEESNE